MKYASKHGMLSAPTTALLLAFAALAAVPISEALAGPSINFTPNNPDYCEPWANCGVHNPNQYTCLNGVLCPLGYSRCGPDKGAACYRDAADAPGVTPAYSCQNNVLVQTLISGPSDGSQVTRCNDKKPTIFTLDFLKNLKTSRQGKCTPWDNCGKKTYDDKLYDCVNGALCPKSYTRCGVYTDNYACYLKENAAKDNGASYSCVNNQLVSVPGIDDATAYSHCTEDLVPCAPYDTCGEYDRGQFFCYAGVLGLKGHCLCGDDPLGFAFVQDRGNPIKQTVCRNGKIKVKSQEDPENDGSETCFCKKNNDYKPGPKDPKSCTGALWTNCPGTWNSTLYDCVDGKLCPSGFSRCGTDACYAEGSTYSCVSSELVQGGTDDGTQIDRCFKGPTCSGNAVAWGNCGTQFDTDTYACLNGALCPAGWKKCGDSESFSCYPTGTNKARFCKKNQLVSTGPSDATAISECAPANTNIVAAPTGLSQPTCTGGAQLYTNCEGVDLTTHSCINGNACPIGMALCGNVPGGAFSCYTVGGTHSCVANQLKNGSGKDDGTQLTACKPADPNACLPWTNCPTAFNPQSHACLDGTLCPVGNYRCANPADGTYSCFDPAGPTPYGCRNGNLVQLTNNAQSDNTEVTQCSNADQLKKLVISNVISNVPNSCTVWTNCAGVYDTNVYWCLNGQLCPAGSARCGPPSGPFSCYEPGAKYSCVNNVLQEGPGKDDVTSVGRCQTAAQTYCAPWKNCGLYDSTKFACLDGKLCPIGNSRCPTSFDQGYVCYNPTTDFKCVYGPPITACANSYATLPDNIVVNGDFESVTFANAGQAFVTAYAPNKALLTAWSVVPNPFSKNLGSIDVVMNYWVPSSGSRSLDMSGDSNGAISQVIITTPGAYYDLFFDLSKNPDDPRDNKLNVIVGDLNTTVTCPLVFNGTTRTKGNMAYETKKLTFLATAENTTLTFAENDANGGWITGCVLDNVRAVVSNQSRTEGVPAIATVAIPECGNLSPWNNCPGVYDTTAYWCLNGNLCPAGSRACGQLGSYSCYNPATMSCAANVLVSTPGLDDQTAMSYCKPTSVCVPWSNCGVPDVDYDTKAFVCLNGRICPAGQLACGNGYKFACYDPRAQPSMSCVQGELLLGTQSDGSETTICQTTAPIPVGFSLQRNADYVANNVNAPGAIQGTCGGVGLGGKTSAECQTACTATVGCIGFTLTGQQTPPTSDDCCFLKSNFQQFNFAAGTDTYFMPLLVAPQKDIPGHDLKDAPFNSPTCSNAGKVVASVHECQMACLANQQCVAFTHVPGTGAPNSGCCSLKSKTTGSNSNNNAVNTYFVIRGALVPPANGALPDNPPCNNPGPWKNCASNKFRATSACLDGQICPFGYLKCGGGTFGSNNYHCFLPTEFTADASNQKVNNVYSCKQNTLKIGTPDQGKSDATAVGPCKSGASQQCSAYGKGDTQFGNCPAFDLRAYACMDQLACPLGQLNCQGACYNPMKFACTPTGLTDDLSKDNPNSSSGPCARAGAREVKLATKPNCGPGQSPWNNCAPATGQYWCVNGQNCLTGFFKCGTSCYDINKYACLNSQLVQPDAFGQLVSDGSQVGPCGPTAQVNALTKLNAPPPPAVVCTGSLWTNCPFAFDANTYWCLNGQICPRGSYRCGAACYDPTAFGCIKGALTAANDLTSDGSQVVPCLAATAQLTITITKNNGGSFTNADSQAIVTSLSNHAGASDATAVSVALISLEVGGKVEIAKVGVPLTAWQEQGVTLLNEQIGALAAQVGATFTVTPTSNVAPSRRRTLLQVDGGQTVVLSFSFQVANTTSANELATQLQGALAPGGQLSTALAGGGISISNVTVAPNITGSNVVATVTLPVRSVSEANFLLGNLTQLASSGLLDTELRQLGLDGSVGTNAQFSILSLTPNSNVTNTTAPAPGPVVAPVPAPAPAPGNTTSAAPGLGVRLAGTGVLSVLVAVLGSMAGLF